VATGFAVVVKLPPDFPGSPEHAVVVDEPVATVSELREALLRRLPEAREALSDVTLNACVNGNMVLSGEKTAIVRNGDEVALIRAMTGG
jgi:aldehyde:ferredoxin oxidoreductase